MEDYSFGEVVAAYTGDDFVPRPWLSTQVEAAIDDPGTRYVLLTAEPGAGKTGFLANLAASHPTWARYFIRRDSAATVTGGDARSFLLAIGHQLAWHHPDLFQPELLDVEVRQKVDQVLAGGKAVGVRIDDLTVSPFYRTAALRLEQSVGSAAGEVVGVEIGRATLDPRLLETANLAHLALIAPAVALAERDPAAKLVVLVDALDEIADHVGFDGLLSWLESGPQLPSNVRFVLTSRAHSKLELLRRRRAGEIVELTIDAASPQVRADLMAYAGRLVGDNAVAAAIRAQGAAPEDVAEEAADRAEGNFAYLVAYSRALTESIARLDDEFRDRLLRFADVPMGLDSLYGLFMEQIRNDVSRMGMMAVAEPMNEHDTMCPAWESVAQPLLGVLVVARDALSLDQLMTLSQVRVWRRDAANVVTRLRQFLDSSGSTVRLFHGSLVEFLVSPAVRDRYPQWAVEPAEWHERIVAAYKAGRGLADIAWDGVDDYGLRHLPVHVTRSRPRVADQVVDLVRPPLRRAMKARFGADGDFLALTDLAAEHVASAMAPAKAVPAMFEIGAAVRYLRQTGPQLPKSVLGALAAGGRADDAVERVIELADPLARVRALDEVLRRAPADQWSDAERHALLRRLTDDARCVIAERGYDPVAVKRDAYKVAALAWAAVDHARAVRLAEAGGCDQSTLDAIHVAAATAVAGTQPKDAETLLAQVRNGRANAYLDVLPDRIAAIEESLGTEPPPGRLRALARIAVTRHRFGTAEPAVRALATEIDQAVAAELVRTSPTGAQDIIAVLAAAADATRMIISIRPEVARALLLRLEQIAMNGLTRDALWAVAKGWLDLGDLVSARRVLDRFVQPALGRNWQGASDLAEASAILAPHDPDEAQRLAALAYAALQQSPPMQDMVAGLLVQGQHAAAARALVKHDVQLAAAVVRRMRAENRSSQGAELADRISMMGELAQTLHDRGDSAGADALLAECLAESGSAGPDVRDEMELPYRVASDGVPANLHFTTSTVWAMYRFNVMEQWRARCLDRVLTRPADVLRWVVPGADSVGSPFTWDRAVRALAVAANLAEPVRAIADPVEHGIGLALLAASARDSGATADAAALAEQTVEVIAAIPQYAWKAAADQVDPDGVADHLLPDQRARFEAALVRTIDARAVVNPLAYRILRAEDLLRYADAVARTDASTETIHRLHGFVGEVLAWPSNSVAERLVVGVTAAGLVAAERAVRGRAEPIPVPPIAVPSQLYAAYADLLSLHYGVPVGDRLLHALKALSESEPVAAAHLAAMAMPVLDDGDLAATVVETARRFSGAATRARILLTFADGMRPADRELADALLDEALACTSTNLHPGEYGELVRMLYPHVVAHRPKLAASWLRTAFAEHWAHAMALLDAAAAELTTLCGTDLVTGLIASHDRARAFGAAALSPLPASTAPLPRSTR